MHALGLWAKSNEKGLQAAANIKSAQAQPLARDRVRSKLEAKTKKFR
jgi:hypothetical protein